MASVNKVILLGNLGKDPETRYLPSGEAVTNFSIATTEKWKDKASGEQKEATEWHRISFFGNLAEVAAKYLKKGHPVYVEGSIHTRKWTDKEGVERYTTEIKGKSLSLLGGSQERPQDAPKGGGSKDSAADDSDIPFASCAIGDDVTFRKLRQDHE